MPTVTIGENTSDDFSGCEEVRLTEVAPTTNQDGSDLQVTKFAASDHHNSLIKFTGLSNIPAGSTITAASINIRLVSALDETAETFTGRRVLRNWVESEATWNVYSTGNSWTTAGALSQGNDISATVSTSDNDITNTGQYWSLGEGNEQLRTDIQNMINGTVPNYGWHLERTDGEDDGAFRQFDDSEGTDGQRPFLSVTYTPPSRGGRGGMGMGLGLGGLGVAMRRGLVVSGIAFTKGFTTGFKS